MYWSWEVAFDVLPQLAKGVVVTVQATIVASLLAYVLGLGIAILKMSKSKLLRVVLYWITEFIRRTPILVQLYIVFYVLPDYGIFFEAFTCGVLVFGIHFSTYTSEVFVITDSFIFYVFLCLNLFSNFIAKIADGIDTIK